MGIERVDVGRENVEGVKCVCVHAGVRARVCVCAGEQTGDKARQSGGKRDGKSLRIEKERAWEDEGETMEGERRATVRDCCSEQYLGQRWRLFLCYCLFFSSSLPPHRPSSGFSPVLSEVTLQPGRNMAAPSAGLKVHKTREGEGPRFLHHRQPWKEHINKNLYMSVLYKVVFSWKVSRVLLGGSERAIALGKVSASPWPAASETSDKDREKRQRGAV